MEKNFDNNPELANKSCDDFFFRSLLTSGKYYERKRVKARIKPINLDWPDFGFVSLLFSLFHENNFSEDKYIYIFHIIFFFFFRK